MAQSVMTPAAGEYHQPMPAVERHRRMRDEIERLLVALPGSDKRSRQLHKDLQSGKLRTADHVAAMVDSALIKHEESKVRAIAHALLAFCTERVARVRRGFSPIYCLETREQGELDNVELAVEQGDVSTPTLERLVKELDDSIAAQIEMKEWAIHQIHVGRGLLA